MLFNQTASAQICFLVVAGAILPGLVVLLSAQAGYKTLGQVLGHVCVLKAFHVGVHLCLGKTQRGIAGEWGTFTV